MDKKKWKFKTGIILLSVSVVIFLMLFALPFVALETKVKIVMSTVLMITGEVMFWVGTLLIGKDVYRKFMAKLKSGDWLEKKKENYDDKESNN